MAYIHDDKYTDMGTTNPFKMKMPHNTFEMYIKKAHVKCTYNLRVLSFTAL